MIAQSPVFETFYNIQNIVSTTLRLRSHINSRKRALDFDCRAPQNMSAEGLEKGDNEYLHLFLLILNFEIKQTRRFGFRSRNMSERNNGSSRNIG